MGYVFLMLAVIFLGLSMFAPSRASEQSLVYGSAAAAVLCVLWLCFMVGV